MRNRKVKLNVSKQQSFSEPDQNVTVSQQKPHVYKAFMAGRLCASDMDTKGYHVHLCQDVIKATIFDEVG